MRAEITCAPVSVAGLAAAVEDRAAGAVVTFDGMVRDHDGGRSVSGVAYCAHPSAGGIVARIADEVAGRPGLRALAVVHRVGDLRVGDTALGGAVSADHRAPAFEAVREVVEEVKRLLRCGSVSSSPTARASGPISRDLPVGGAGRRGSARPCATALRAQPPAKGGRTSIRSPSARGVSESAGVDRALTR